jgi:superfamily II DNA/RNA helicase
MRMICDSTFLFDKTTHVSPKLEEFAELVSELTAESDHKAVVFSQWETMLREAAAVLDRLGIGYSLLHGRIPGPERKALLDRFRNDAACQIFLSTDAGGTGLNLQEADTVIQLDLPWNPAVLEQRVGRVHRMGQTRPVRVISLVTHGTIEDRMIEVMQKKSSLFAGLFTLGSDEVDFSALGQPGMIDAVRDMVGPAAKSKIVGPAEARDKLAAAAVQCLEALAEVIAAERLSLPAELSSRCTTALQSIVAAMSSTED